jgi:nucleoside-diphosphate-sugar epimerase
MAEGLIARQIAVTGGAGFIGTALARRFAANDVRVLDLGIHDQGPSSVEGVER